MHSISSNHLNSDSLKKKKTQDKTIKLGIRHCFGCEQAGMFGRMTIKLEDAKRFPVLISPVHPFCIVSTSFGLRVWQVEGGFIFLENMT